MAVRIYKKLCYVETRYNINRLLAWAVFGAARVDKICLFDFILVFMGDYGRYPVSMVMQYWRHFLYFFLTTSMAVRSYKSYVMLR